MSPAELKMQPTIHFQSELEYRILICVNCFKMLLIILFVTSDIYEKVKIQRLKCIRAMRETRRDFDLWQM
jgi:hypothetical protein